MTGQLDYSLPSIPALPHRMSVSNLSRWLLMSLDCDRRADLELVGQVFIDSFTHPHEIREDFDVPFHDLLCEMLRDYLAQNGGWDDEVDDD